MDSTNDPSQNGRQNPAKLSGHDRNILDRIFNPNLPYSEDDPETETDDQGMLFHRFLTVLSRLLFGWILVLCFTMLRDVQALMTPEED